MELRQLRVFIAVAEELHFGRAAARVHLAQPSISAHVRQLERELQVSLLHRTSRQVTLTDAGHALLDDARRIVQHADAAADNARSWGEGRRARLRVGYVAECVPRVLPVALRRLSSLSTPPRVELVSADPGELVDRVRRAEIDTAIVPVPLALHGLHATTLTRERAAVAVSVDALHGEEDEIPLELVADGTLRARTRDRNPGLHNSVAGACAAAGLPCPLREIRGASVEHLLLGVAAGEGRALVPYEAARRAAVPGVALRRLTAPTPVGYDVALITASRVPGTAVTALREALTR